MLSVNFAKATARFFLIQALHNNISLMNKHASFISIFCELHLLSALKDTPVSLMSGCGN